MKREFSQEDMERILKSDAVIPSSVNERIHQTYQKLGLINDPGYADSKEQPGRHRTVRRRHRTWVSIAAAAALIAGLGVTVAAAVNLLSVRVTQTEDEANFEISINPEAKEAHKINVEAGYMPDGYLYQEEGPHAGKWYNEATEGSITIIDYNAALLYEMNETDTPLIGGFSLDSLEENLTDKVQIPGMQISLVDRESVYKDDQGTHRTLCLFNPEYGYVVQIFDVGGSLPADELFHIASELKIDVLDETEPYPGEEEILALKKEQQKSQELSELEGIVPASSVYKAGDLLTMQSPDATEYPESAIQYKVTDIRILDALPLDQFPEQYFNIDYDTEFLPLLNSDGSLKPHERYASLRWETDQIETGGSRFIVLSAEITNRSSETLSYEAPMLRLLEPDSSQELHRIDGHRPALSAYEALTVDGAPIYQSPASNGGKSMNYTDIQGGETIEYTAVYVVDDDCVDLAYLSFFGGTSYSQSRDSLLTEPYLKVQE